jgi:hypothetical protein
MKHWPLLATWVVLSAVPGSSRQCSLESWTPSDLEAGDALGFSVALDGDRAVIGALFGYGAFYDDSGAAYVLRGSGSSWEFEARLVAGDQYGDWVGGAVDVSGDVIAVGAARYSQPYSEAGAVYVFERVNGVWTQTAFLQASNLQFGRRRFGEAVEIEGDRLLIGAPSYPGQHPGTGAVYEFEREGNSWLERSHFSGTGLADGDRFGSAMQLQGTTLVVGAPHHSGGASDTGIAFVFERGASGWTQVTTLVPAEVEDSDTFGNSVAIDEETILAGAPGRNAGASNSGAVYEFSLVGGTWVETNKLVPNEPVPFENFGYSLDMGRDTALVGSWAEPGLSNLHGNAYFWERLAGNWTQISRLTTDGPDDDDEAQFGTAVALSGSSGTVGAWREDQVALDSGAVYLGDLRGSEPTRYCQAGKNSTGGIASIGFAGSTSLTSNAFFLRTDGGVPNEFAMFYYGSERREIPFGDGFLCLAPGGNGLIRLGPPRKLDSAGEVLLRADFELPPMNDGKGEILAGSTWNFQLQYRDPHGPGGTGFNLTDALSVHFCP